MRKGFTLTLTALISAFLVTSALALGPTVSGIPDIYIGPNAAADAAVPEPGINTFRYSDALVLWDYVTPGSEDADTPDSLVWGYSVKNATLSGPTGAFLDPSDPNAIHYSIIQEDGLVVDAILPANAPGTELWTAEINGALGNDQTLDKAGALTFRNVRVSGLPEQTAYPAPTAVAGLPAGYLDVQEATLYVADGSTTPGTDQVLLITIDATIDGGRDSLSGGPAWEEFQAWTSTTGFNEFRYSATIGGHVNAGGNTNPSGVTITNSGTSVAINTPLAQSSTLFYYVTTNPAAVSLVGGTLYRGSATITSNQALAATPNVLFGLNGRAAGTGFGYVQFATGYADGPTAASKTFNAYLVPAADGNATLELAVFDAAGTTGGIITGSNFAIDKIDDMTALQGANELVSADTFQRGTVDGDNWFFQAVKYGDAQNPTISGQPAAGATGSELVITGTTNSAANQAGYADFTDKAVFTPAAGKLVVIKAMVTSTTATPAAIPSLWLATGQGQLINGFLMDSTAATGPSATAKAYYVVMDGAAAACDLSFRGLVDTPAKNGNLRLQSYTVTEYDQPAE